MDADTPPAGRAAGGTAAPSAATAAHLGLADLDGAVAVVTGAAGGIGLAVAGRLASAGAHVVVGDVDDERGRQCAEAVGADYVHCDVTRPDDSVKLVEEAVRRHGGLDLAVLNAGIATGPGWLDTLDLDRYDLVRAVDLDGVVYGIAAALPALRDRLRDSGRAGSVVSVASLAGLTPTADDLPYAAAKTAVVGLSRSLGEALAREGLSADAVCPGFADTAMVDPFADAFHAAGYPLLTADHVAAAVVAAATSGRSGEAWVVQPGREPQPYAFRGVPGPRNEDGSPVGRTAQIYSASAEGTGDAAGAGVPGAAGALGGGSRDAGR